MAGLKSILFGPLGSRAIDAVRKSMQVNTPATPTLPLAPVIDRAADASAARLASERARAFASGSEGRQGTLLTGPMGVTSPAPTKKKTLLGE